MTDHNDDRRQFARRTRPLAWGGAAVLILGPLIALKLADPLAWEAGDLPFALAMIGGVGLAYELAVRTRSSRAYRGGAALALAAGLLLAWGNLAVGFVGSEDNPLNLIYFAVVGVAVAGSLAAGFRPGGMAIAMSATAAAQIAAGLVALLAGAFTGPLTIFFAGLWLASAWLFRRAAREPAAVAPSASPAAPFR